MAMFGSSSRDSKGPSVWELIATGEAGNRSYRSGLDPYGIFGAPQKDLATTIADLLLSVSSPPPSPPDPFFSSLANALNQPLRRPLPEAYGVFSPPAPALRPLPQPPVAPLVRRNVFFSFHYEEDIRRSCVVRNSYKIRPGQRHPAANFYDRSLWERSKREGLDSLKRLIREGMSGSTVTCVLAGTNTWLREWVRFEIAHSLLTRKGLFTCFIHNVKDPRHGASAPGYDPLAVMGLQLRPDGRGNVVEWVNGEWWPFELMKVPVPWPAWMGKPSVGRLFPLADFAPAYDYYLDDGYSNLSRWAQAAARAAGRD